MTVFGNQNLECSPHFLLADIHHGRQANLGNVEATNGVIAPPGFCYLYIGPRCHRRTGTGLYSIRNPAIGAVLPAIFQNDDGANRKCFPSETDSGIVLVAVAHVIDQFIVAVCIDGIPEGTLEQFRLELNIMNFTADCAETILKAVSCCIHIVIHITVAAEGTGMGGVTLLGAGGGGHNKGVVVGMLFFRHINAKYLVNVLSTQIHDGRRSHLGNIEATDGVIAPPLLRHHHIRLCGCICTAALHGIRDPAVGAVLPATFQYNNGADRQFFLCEAICCKEILTVVGICNQHVIPRFVSRVPISTLVQFRLEQDIALIRELRFFLNICRLGHLEGLCSSVVGRLNGNGLFFRIHAGGRIGDIGNIQAGQCFNKQQSGQITTVIIAHVVAVPGGGVSQQRGTGVLYRRAVGNDQIEIAVGDDLVLHSRHDGVVHGHLILAIGGECAVGRVLLIGPGHVPDQLGIGAGLHIGDQIRQIIVVAAFHTADRAALLHGYIVPSAAFQSGADFVAAGRSPGAIIVVVISILAKISGCVFRVGFQCAAADVEIADGDFLNAQILRDLVCILQRVHREAVADGKNLQNAIAVGVPFIHTTPSADAVFVGVVAVQEIYLIAFFAIPHDHVDSDCTIRSSDKCIGGELRIDIIRRNRFQYTVFIKPAQSDAVAATTIGARLLERSRPNLISGSNRNRDGINAISAYISPSTAGVIGVFGHKTGPEICTAAQVFGKLLQVILVNRFDAALGRDHDISGHLCNGNHTIGVNGICHIRAAHGDGNCHILAGNGCDKGLSVGYTLVVAQRAFRAVQVMSNGMDDMLASFHFHIVQKRIQNSPGNVVHAGGIGVNSVGQVSGRNAAITKINIGDAIVFTNGGKYRIILSQFGIGIVTGCIGGKHCKDFCFWVIIL